MDSSLDKNRLKRISTGGNWICLCWLLINVYRVKCSLDRLQSKAVKPKIHSKPKFQSVYLLIFRAPLMFSIDGEFLKKILLRIKEINSGIDWVYLKVNYICMEIMVGATLGHHRNWVTKYRRSILHRFIRIIKSIFIDFEIVSKFHKQRSNVLCMTHERFKLWVGEERKGRNTHKNSIFNYITDSEILFVQPFNAYDVISTQKSNQLSIIIKNSWFQWIEIISCSTQMPNHHYSLKLNKPIA